MLNSHSLWNQVWLSIPEFVCWKLWLARNDLIFNNSDHSALYVVAKAKALLIEALGNCSFESEISLTLEERSWMGTLQIRDRKKKLARPIYNPAWKIRMTEAEFRVWWRKQGKVMIFFDGASKGNPGISSVGWVIYSHDGLTKDSFSWGLGHNSNNQEEILGLFKGC